MSSLPVSIRVAQAIGLTGAAFLAGNITSFALNVIPSLRNSRTKDNVPAQTIAKQWTHMYHYGKTQNPPISVVSAAALGYVAWSVRSGTELAKLVPRNASPLYAASAVLIMAIAPYTVVFMTATNDRLHAHAAATEKTTAAEKNIEELLKKWDSLNLIRGLLPLAAAALGMIAVLG
ncbi:DUF1772-domain-containing protein [Trichodelitschia bisporula]|uniref:DUF1772-domain-containing protein n=1 Tax=Trichodelitschia bisporula TaxID=703511 RepID=A0A6G1I805_9PEZI|nr:DUF1772-domain-containing protein [Trichodelitschia bisporula]